LWFLNLTISDSEEEAGRGKRRRRGRKQQWQPLEDWRWGRVVGREGCDR